MCTDIDNYTSIPAMTVGGPPGDYIIRCPIPSSEYAEFSIVSVAVIGNNSAVIQASGLDRPRTLDTSGTSVYNDTTFIRSQVTQCPANTSIPIGDSFYDRIGNERGDVFIRIDGAVAAFVTVKMRVKKLTKIPAPFTTVHPEDREQYHYERERRIQDATLGQEGEMEVYGTRPGRPGVRSLTTGEPPVEYTRTQRGVSKHRGA